MFPGIKIDVYPELFYIKIGNQLYRIHKILFDFIK